MEKKTDIYKILTVVFALAFIIASVAAYYYYDKLSEERDRLTKCINSFHDLRVTFIKDNKAAKNNMVDYYNFVATHAHGMTINEFTNKQGNIRTVIDAHDNLDKDLQALLPY